MTPDDPIYDPVRQIAEATRGIAATLASLDTNLGRLTTNAQETHDLVKASLHVERALGWSILVALGMLMFLGSVLILHVLGIL